MSLKILKIKAKFLFRLVLVVLITLVFCAVYIQYIKMLDRQLAKEQEAFGAQGYPVTLQELDHLFNSGVSLLQDWQFQNDARLTRLRFVCFRSNQQSAG